MKYWEAGGKQPQKQSTVWSIAWAVMVITIGALLGVLSYSAMVHEMSRYDELREKRAEESALAKLKNPVDYSLPEHYFEMIGEKK